MLPIRTVPEMPIKFALVETRRPFPYQAIAQKALALHRLGMSATAIARMLSVIDKTVTKASIALVAMRQIRPCDPGTPEDSQN